MDVNRFIRLTSTQSAISTIILLIPIAIGFWQNIPLIYAVSLFVIIGFLNLVFVYFGYKKPSMNINELLELMVISLWGSKDTSHYRTNVMLYDDKTKKLKIKHDYNMLGKVDRAIELLSNQGCAGKAYTLDRETWVDLTVATHESFGLDTNDVWKDMKSVVSVPIRIDCKIVGVLNIDSDFELSKSELDDDKVLNAARAYSDMIADWL